jgi:hypothetical protein
MAEEKPERLGTILLRIETLLTKIALQMDIELDECAKEVAVLRRTRRHPCACRAAETIENKAGSS